jgi:HK97 gp10 family phage protein
MPDALVVSLDVSGLNQALSEIGEAILANVRPAAQAGAQVLYDEMRQRVPVSAKGHWFHGKAFRLNGTKYWFDAGSLRASIYQAYSKDNSGARHAVYHVSWNEKEAPYAHMVEFGTKRAPAHPFLRPTFDAKATAAAEAMNAKFQEGMQQVLSRFAQ